MLDVRHAASRLSILMGFLGLGLFMVSDPNFVPTAVSESLPAVETLDVYPNPARGMVTLSGMASAERMRLLNLVGKEVRPWQRVPGLQGLNVDVSDLGEGIYFIQAESASGAVRTTRVVVQK